MLFSRHITRSMFKGKKSFRGKLGNILILGRWRKDTNASTNSRSVISQNVAGLNPGVPRNMQNTDRAEFEKNIHLFI